MATGAAADARVKLMCSHGGRLVPCGPGGALRYVGGETRVLAVPRAASFRDLAARLSSEIAGGAEVRAVRHRLADDEGVFVSVTSDEEVAHMFDEYDRLRATRPSAAFRVFVSTDPGNTGAGAGVQRRRLGWAAEATGIPHRCPQTAAIRRVQSDQALAARAHLHRLPAPVRRVHSSPELAPASRLRTPSFHHRCRCACHQVNQCAAAPPPPSWPVYGMPYMSQVGNGGRSRGREPSPAVSSAAKAKPSSRDAKAAVDAEKGRAIWELQ